MSVSRTKRRTSSSRVVIANALLAVACLLSVAGAQETFTPKHVAKLRSVTAAETSPDGTTIAYVLSVPREPGEDESGPSWAELHVTDLAGNARPYVSGDVNVSRVRWTPDGRSISFLAKRGKDEHTSLYVIPVDGGEARNVLSHETDIDEYSWSPDAKRVVFRAREKEPKEQKKLEDKGFNQEIFEEDQREVYAYVGVVGDDEAEPRRLELPGVPSDLVWSPVGSQVAMALAPTPFIDDHYMERKLHVFDADTGAIVSSFKNPGKLGDFQWSPDGERLAVISAEDRNDPAEGRLIVANPTDGSLADVLPNFEGHVRAIAWQDATTIMYLGDKGVWTELGEVQKDGTAHKVHLPAGKAVLATLSLSEDGQTAATLSDSPAHPTELFVMAHGDSGPRRLTNSNPWLADMRLAKQEIISYKARDGLRLEGILIRPLDEQPNTRYPLILVVHGGPESHYRNGWVTRYASPGQVGAANGYAIFHPNYRASTGRGVPFSKLDHGDPAGKEFDDLVDGVDHLVELGLVDKAKVGVTGGSYGGYATAWCSTYYSERFAAGVMFVGLSNLVSKSGETDIPNEMTLVHWRKRLWDDWELFLKRSPVHYVEKARTPLLILHGQEDARVHPSQSLELYRHLKVLGQTPVRLVRYPGEGHGNRKSAARYDYNLRMMRWFDHYLKGPGGPPPPYELDYGIELKEKDAEKPSDKEV